jgi:hypothetical protein
MKKVYSITIVLLLLSLSSCDLLLGKKDDTTVDDIFVQGNIDPNLYPNQVGYLPVLPYWQGFSNPIDVCVGYDEMVYVVDDNGVNILDQKGTRYRAIAIPGATDVTQDRMLNTYVLGRVNKSISGTIYNLAAVYVIANSSSAAAPLIKDTLIHPFNDVSRNNTAFRGVADEQVQFTGIAATFDNTIYVSRTGPTNDLTSTSRPDNTVLIYDESGVNTGYSNGLNPVTSSLKSCLDVASIATFTAPPQSIAGVNQSKDFILVQNNDQAQFAALWIKQTVDPDGGLIFTENSTLTIFDYTKADRFLYQPFRFSSPSDVFIAPDITGYIFIVDSEKDSLYQFTNKGFEGVNPPANSGITKQILASFGGTGSGPFQFNDPSGVCYFRKVIYVADKNNGRISRFKLSTDVE